MGLTTTGLYAALLAIVMVVLLGNVGRLRSRKGISLGDNGDRDLVIATRRHMNFVECVPLALILLAVVEANGAARGWVHALGILLLVSRLIHPFGIDPDDRGGSAHGALAVCPLASDIRALCRD